MDSLISGVVGEYLARQFGGRFTYTVTRLSVGTTVSTVAKRDPERVFLLIMNTSVNTLKLSLENTVNTNQSIFVAPSGGMVSFNMVEDFIMPTLEFKGLATAGSSYGYLIEVRRYAKLTEEEINNAE